MNFLALFGLFCLNVLTIVASAMCFLTAVDAAEDRNKAGVAWFALLGALFLIVAALPVVIR